MPDRGSPHQPTTILSARLAGRVMLSRNGEASRIRTLTRYLKVMIATIENARGRLVDTPGDDILAEFTGAADAVDCAVEIQRQLMALNAGLPDNGRVQFSIGVHLGDSLAGAKQGHGNRVTSPAALEDLAEAGGICISGAVYDVVESMVGLEFERLGERTVKNSGGPVRMYRLRFLPGEAARHGIETRPSAGRQKWETLVAILAAFIAATLLVIWNLYH